MKTIPIITYIFFSTFLTLVSPSCFDEIKTFPGYKCAQENLLDKGSTGSIYLVRDAQYVLRVMKVSNLFERSIAERVALSKLKGEPYITQIIDWKESNNKMYLILEYASRGNLFDFIENKRYLEEPSRVFQLFYKIFLGLRAIHRNNMVHADMKLANIVIDEDYNPLIIDFDTVEYINVVDSPRGSMNYMSPEIVREYENYGYVKFSPSNDLFSFGVMLYYAFKKQYAFDMDEYVYYDMMNTPIQFVRGDAKDFFDLCFGLLKPASARMTSDSALEILSKAKSKQIFEILEYDFRFTLQHYATKEETAYNYSKIWVYMILAATIVTLNMVISLIIMYFMRKKKMRAKLELRLERIVHQNCSSSDAAISMMTTDS